VRVARSSIELDGVPAGSVVDGVVGVLAQDRQRFLDDLLQPRYLNDQVVHRHVVHAFDALEQRPVITRHARELFEQRLWVEPPPFFPHTHDLAQHL
jgi:hypothetical protein